MRFKHVNDVALLNQVDFRLLAKLMWIMYDWLYN